MVDLTSHYPDGFKANTALLAPLKEVSGPINFETINQSALAQLPALLKSWLPGGRLEGREYVTGSLNGGIGNSCKVNTETGKWSDFATGEAGGDPVSLYAAVNNLSQGDAAREIAGLNVISTIQPIGNHPKQPQQAIQPIPEKAGEPTCVMPGLGEPSEVWRYADATGNTLHFVARYETAEGKEYRPWTWNGTKWEPKAPPEPRPLYGLDQIAQKPDASIILCEGEKAADACQRIYPDAVSVSWSGGSNAVVKADFSPLEGRKVTIWPDADGPGQKAAEKAAQALQGIGAGSVGVLNVSDMPDKWDAADAEAEGWGRDQVNALLASSVSKDAHTPINWESCQGEPPEMEWLWHGLIPKGHVTSLYGDGGSGKTLLAQILATMVATGQGKYLGQPVKSGPVLGLFAEDDEEELWRRQARINENLNIDMNSLFQSHIVSGFGFDNLLMIFDRAGGELTNLYGRLENLADQVSPELIIVDNAADTFGGEESKRHHVNQFLKVALGGLAQKTGAAVLLLAHPSIYGLQSGAGFSGSTAWNNSVRSRLLLERMDKETPDFDPDVRFLRTMKANYAQIGDVLQIRWKDGVFIHDAEPSGFVAHLDTKRKCRIVFEELARVISGGEPLSPNSRAGNYAARRLINIASLSKLSIKRKEIEQHIDRLQQDEFVAVETYRANGKDHQRLVITEAGLASLKGAGGGENNA